MKAVVLSAISPENEALSALSALLDSELARAGYDVIVRFDLCAEKLAFCQGEFDCWVRTPGRCKSNDVEQRITEALPSADAMVLVGPILFGGWDYTMKRAIDRLICLISPFFETRAALTHHSARYQCYPRWFSVGMLPATDEAQRATFEALTDGNAINFWAPARGSAVVDEVHPEQWASALRTMFADRTEPGSTIANRDALRAELVDAARAEDLAGAPITRAALLVGSAKPKGTSASEGLGRRLMDRIAKEPGGDAVRWEVHHATEFVREGLPALAAARSIAAADLFVLAAPLYIDALPALVTHALELIARARAGAPTGGALFVPLINCGFPEPEHTRTAIRIGRHFASAAGYRFGGALPLGGGGIVVGNPDLEHPGPATAHIARALDLAAPAIAMGRGVPDAAIGEMIVAPIPEVLYRTMGNLGWRVEAWKRGTGQLALSARPFA